MMLFESCTTRPVTMVRVCSVPLLPSCARPNLLTYAQEIGKGSTIRKRRNFATSDDHVKCRQYTGELSFKFRDECYEQKVEEVRRFLESSADEYNDPMKSLILVDEIQRLDLDSHFHEQIKAIFKQHYWSTKPCDYKYYNLHHASLSFKLFRQEGYHAQADVFTNYFKGKDGMFTNTIRKDTIGLIELYEASQLCLEGEEILDDAANFSRQILQESMANVDQRLSRIIDHTLRHPYHRSMARLSLNDFVYYSKAKNGWGKKINELAKLNFSMLKSIHRQELHQVLAWWTNLGLAEELKLARNQPVKWYTWSMAILNDPSFGEERIQLTKCIAFIYIIDDIFDVYGVPQDLVLFTEAINRWEYAAMDMLPDYMKVCYKALLDTMSDIGLWIYKKHGNNPIDTLREAWTTLCNAFLIEAKWFTSRELPIVDDYLENGKLSCGVHIMLIVPFYLLGINPTTQNSTHLNDTCELISSVATIFRLCDDLGSAKDENQDGSDGSYIECYMKEHEGISFDDGRKLVLDMISSEWKRLNKEYFRLNRSSSTSYFAKAALNFARMIPIMYSYDEKQRLPLLDEYIKSMLFDDAC
uniref:Chloroplast nerolidol/linalool synthase n=1 Tax=Jasminum sambac TaxID=660624 RepID=A0A411KY86_9LAMI|nr:chloroplast nerolidol/linalool synthase [Jasminum sambac]